MKLPDNFQANIDMTRSMERLRDDPTPAGKLRFFKELKAARFLVPCMSGEKNLAILNTSNGEAFLPAFSRAEELTETAFPACEATVLPLDALKHIVIDQPAKLTGVVIDPFGKALLLRQPQLAEMDSFTEGMTLKRTEHEKPQLLSAAKDFPVGLPVFLSRLLRTRPEVYRAWLLSARKDMSEAPHLLVLIDFDGDRKRLFPTVAKAVEPFMRPGESFELMKADYTAIQSAQAAASAIYTRPAEGV